MPPRILTWRRMWEAISHDQGHRAQMFIATSNTPMATSFIDISTLYIAMATSSFAMMM